MVHRERNIALDCGHCEEYLGEVRVGTKEEAGRSDGLLCADGGLGGEWMVGFYSARRGENPFNFPPGVSVSCGGARHPLGTSELRSGKEVV